MRKKALLALTIATAILNSSPEAIASEKNAPTKSLSASISDFAADKQMAPEYRAQQLIGFASHLLRGESSAYVENMLSRKKASRSGTSLDEGSNSLIGWSRSTSQYVKAGSMMNSKLTDEQKALAELATAEATKLAAVSQLKHALPLEFAIASLLKRLDKPDELESCNGRIEKLVTRCEKEKKLDPAEIKAAAAVLNYGAGSAEAASLGDDGSKTFSKMTEVKFRENESRRRRAIALLDKLPSSDHDRRMAHRNLVMMYRAQGDTDAAEKEKQVLFQLVGITDDSILKPTRAGCGHVVWWRTHTVDLGFDCGMG